MTGTTRPEQAADGEIEQWDEVAPSAEDAAVVASVLAALRRDGGVDFSDYKPSTLRRRIERRTAIRQLDSLPAYLNTFLAEAGEREALADDLLIGVTEFFRDPEVFQYLRTTLFPDLLRDRSPRQDFRIWSAGCATGEEAYTLAMLAMEAAALVGFTGQCKVFATDLQQKNLDVAARGVYGPETMARLPEALRQRWLAVDGEGNRRVVPELRRNVVFARHNLLVDPPFTRIDLVVCRNLLIYLKPTAQLQVLSQLHFALKPRGLLLLGSSETVGGLEGSEFEAIERAWRVYRKQGEVSPRQTGFPVGGGLGMQMLSGLEGGAVIDRRLLRDYDILLKRHLPPGMLVDGDRRVLHWFGDLGMFLKAPEGRVEEDVLQLVHESLRSALGLALHRAAETHGRAVAENVPLRLADGDRPVTVSVDCIPDDRSHSAHFHVAFALAGEVAAEPRPAVTELASAGLEIELQAMRERLHQTIIELQASNERLDLANEELTASNEELQSTNEELKSVNEDLYSLNAELEGKNGELVQLNRDYDNLLASSEVGTLFLDSALQIRKFSPGFERFMRLMPQDVGRPVADIACLLAAQEELLADLEAVRRDGRRIERELRETGGTHYLLRVLPFHDENGRQDGVVMTLTDITAVRTIEAEREHLKSILDALPYGVYIVNPQHEIEYVNPVLQSEFGPIEGRRCHDYFHGLPGACTWCKNDAVLAGGTVRWEWTSPKGRTYDLFDIPFENADGSVSKLEIFNDITERKRAEQELAQSEARQRSVLAAMNDGVICWDPSPRIVLANAAAERILGRPGGLLGEPGDAPWEIVDESGQPLPNDERPVFRVLRSGQPVTGVVLGCSRPTGSPAWLLVNAEPMFDDGRLAGVVTSFSDISRLKEIEAILVRSRDYHLALLESFPALVWRAGTDARCNYFNQTWLEFTGRRLEEELGDGWAEGVHPDDLPACLASYRAHFEARRPFALEYRLRRHDGAYRWILDIGRPFQDVDGGFAGYLGACFDVTDRREADDRLRLAARVFEESGEAIMITDADERIVEVNRACCDITGYSAAELVGKTPAVLASGRHDAEFFQRLHQALGREGYWHGEIWNRKKSGEIFPSWMGVSAVRDGGGQVSHYLGIFSDITEKKSSQARIEYMSHHDALTGLPNRLLFRERFDLALAYAQRTGNKVALLCIDVDRFKAINDSLGHAVGDDLLRSVAKRLRDCIRDTDTLSRQGGDEFLVVLGAMKDDEAASQVADKMMAAVARPFQVQSHELSISLSVGIAVYPSDGSDYETLLKMADTAMYHAKETGRNAYRFFDQRMNSNAAERLETANGLRRALARNEFRLHYQPQVDIASGRVIGVEALIRWQNPEAGLISPAQFIPVAEDSGLIVPIGEWVINEACRQAIAWQAAGGPEITVAVNLSAIQFRRGDIEQTVMGALARSGLDPRCLELELTESLLLSDTDHVLATVHRLKALGIRLSIDDFGTGYSSLAYLKRFAVDRLKIDQSFVRDMSTDPDAASIVRAIIQMARSLNLKTVSEGVEDERLLDYLRVLHCDEAQGYFFARPMPGDDFLPWLNLRA